jgi:hypothetical protein
MVKVALLYVDNEQFDIEMEVDEHIQLIEYWANGKEKYFIDGYTLQLDEIVSIQAKKKAQ